MSVETWNSRDLNVDDSGSASLIHFRPKKGDVKIEGNSMWHWKADEKQWELVPIISKSKTKWHVIAVNFWGIDGQFKPRNGQYHLDTAVIIRTGKSHAIGLYNVTAETMVETIKSHSFLDSPDDEIANWPRIEMNTQFIANGIDEYQIQVFADQEELEYIVSKFRLQQVG